MRISLKQREGVAGLAFAMPSIFGITVFFALPFLVSLYYSVTNGVSGGNFVGLQNYKELFLSSAFRLAAYNTLKFIAVAIPLIMALSLFVSLLLFKKLKGHEFFRTVFVFPLVLPAACVILFFQILFHDNGALNSLLFSLGLPAASWLNSSLAFYVLVLLYLWKNIGYNIILFLAALNTVPKELYEAAALDGASARHRLFKITLPLISRYSFFIAVISVINSFKIFREAFMLCGMHPHKSIYMLQHFLNNNFSNLNFQGLSAASCVLFIAVIIPVCFMLITLNKHEVRQ